MLLKSFIMIMLLGASFAVVAQKSPLEGTWKMISGSTKSGDSTSTNDLTAGDRMKIVSGKDFVFFAVNQASGDIVGAFTGTVSIEGDKYTETILHATGTANTYPTVSKFTYQLTGDKWHIKGGYETYVFDEVWQKVR